jgi:hypothetical protein
VIPQRSVRVKSCDAFTSQSAVVGHPSNTCGWDRLQRLAGGRIWFA